MTDLELYTKAKEAYYNGESIMTDYEFDELEKKLGLENKSYVGAKHNPSYTIQHPYIMGSLSKVQVKEKDGVVDWDGYWNEVKRFICKNAAHNFIITPKYDGCSFEAYFNHGKLTISTRGDGEFGKNIEKHIARKFNATHYYIADNCDEYTLRGEVLIKKDVFEAKYADFVNPRSFVSGVLNRDYSEDADFQAMLDDLSIVIYDVRVKADGIWNDLDWADFKIDNTPDEFWSISLNEINFKVIYESFARYREKCPYALDGIVFKPVDNERMHNTTETRPKDCVAVKFMPMLQETEIIDMEWSVAKNGEMRPVIITNPVIMDGKSITRASAHNYGYLVDNKLGIGAKVILSLAGDIIPFIYKITDTTAWDADIDRESTIEKIGLDRYGEYGKVIEFKQEGCHLYKLMSDDEVCEQKFIESASTLGIPSAFGTSFALLAISTFLLTTLDTCTRLARYILEEFVGKKNLVMDVIYTLCVIAFPVIMIFIKMPDPTNQGAIIPVWKAIWPLFGATNQLLAALALLVVYVVRKYKNKSTWFIFIPMLFMMLTSIAGLGQMLMESYRTHNILTFVLSGILFFLTLFICFNVAFMNKKNNNKVDVEKLNM